MVRARQSGNSLLAIIVGMLAVMIAIAAGIAFAWYYLEADKKHVPPIAYSSFDPIVVRSSGFAIKTTIVLQTAPEEAAWVQGNKAALTVALQTALASADLERVKTPDGVAYVQGLLRDAANKALQTRSVQEVLLTDYVLQLN
ncbi:Flagellar basal body-associated protein FliL [compost metagenome]|jgi:flagellar basal body-associated protein FliL